MQTTIKLSVETKKTLDSFREHPRETYDQVIRKLSYIAGHAEDKGELSAAAVKAIREARARIEKGEFVTWEEAQRKLALRRVQNTNRSRSGKEAARTT